MDLTLIPFVQNDPDTHAVKEMHDEPSVSKYIFISDNFFDYVVNSENVVYFKIKLYNELIGGIHTEIAGSVLHLSICILPEYRKKGFAAAALKKMIPLIPQSVDRIQVSICETNIPSIRLFESLGFSRVGQEENLADYCLDLL